DWDDTAKVYVPLSYHNFASLSMESAKLIVKGAIVAFVLLVVFTCWTPTTQRQGWRLAAEFGIVTLGMLLFSERTWKHHAVTLLLPFAVLAYCVVEGLPARAQRWLVGATLVACLVLIGLTSNGLVNRSLAKLSQV